MSDEIEEGLEAALQEAIEQVRVRARFVDAVPGTRVHLIFRAQPFSVQPNPRTMEMDVKFNVQSGVVHGYDEVTGTFQLTSGNCRWTFRQKDILGWADADRKALD